MSNITKNLLLALALVSVIVLIVFCIQLIVINRGVEPVSPGTTVSGDSQQEDEDPDPEENGEDPANGEDVAPDPVIQPPRQPPQGTRYELRVTENSRLIVYASEELFDFMEEETDWWFIYNGGGIATLEIAFTLVSPQGTATHAETFLNDYSGGSTSEFTGEEMIHGSAIRGYHVSTQHDGEWYEAWIHTLVDSDLALVFVINYSTEQQREALYDILSTLEMVSTTASASQDASQDD